MPKHLVSSVYSSSSDADFRTWVAEIITGLLAAGLVQTSDTGQINTSTVLRPGTNVVAGYAIFRFDDTLQTTAPIYLKVEFGTGSTTSAPLINWTVGTGSNGSGTLTGPTSGFGGRSSTAPTGTRPSYFTHGEGFLCVALRVYSSATVNDVFPGSIILQRTVDNTGAPTADGAQFTVGGYAAFNARDQPARTDYLDFHTLTFRGQYTHTLVGFAPGFLLDSRVGLAPQFFLHWCAQPKMSPLVCSSTYLQQEVSLLQENEIALVGTTPVNYIAVGDVFGVTAAARNAAVTDRASMLMRWED